MLRWKLETNLTCCELPRKATRPGALNGATVLISDDSPSHCVAPRCGALTTTGRDAATHYFGGMNDETHDFDADAEIAFLRETAAADLLANHFFVLAQWAAVHLAASPADLAGAQLVIDAMAAMLAAGATRLGPNLNLYRSALSEIQQVYVRASQVADAAAPDETPREP